MVDQETKAVIQRLKPYLTNEEWRVSHLYFIINKKKELVRFKPNSVQRHFNANRHGFDIILKARQEGFTTDACVRMLDKCIFEENFNAVIIAHDKESLKKIFKKVKIAWDKFPLELKNIMRIEEVAQSTTELAFNNGSRVAVTLSARSDTVNWLHVSEFGKICKKYPEKAEEIVTGSFPAVPEGGRITIESTAEGEEGHYHDMFQEAWDADDKISDAGFKAHFYSWTMHSEYQTTERFDLFNPIKGWSRAPHFVEYKRLHRLTEDQLHWYYKQAARLKGKVRQEYPTTPEEAFEGSGNKVFDVDILKVKLETEVEQGEKVGAWVYFGDYNARHRYALGADPSEGVGIDHSAAAIIDFSANGGKKARVVGVYKNNKIDPGYFAYEVKNGGARYGNCLAGVERNNSGHATLTKLREIYYNIYTEVREDKMTKQKTERLGWLTNAQTKPKMIFDLKEAIEEDLLEIPHKGMLRELMRYDDENLRQLRFDPEVSNHFDLVTALAIAWQMRDHVGKGLKAGDLERRVQWAAERASFDPHKPL